MSHFFRCLFGLAGLVLWAGAASAQNTAGYGDWQLHLPTNHPVLLADAGNRLYVATENNFYFLDKKQATTQVLSRRDGLNDVGVTALAYDSVTQQTVLGYLNANIDVLRPDGSVRNLNDVMRKIAQGGIQVGNRPINRISIGNGKAYVSASFGVVVIDLLKLEITDTYSSIGPGGAIVSVYDAVSTGGYLYLATSAGLLRGALNTNLLDYNNWTVSLPVPLVANRPVYRLLAAYEGQVYAAVDNSGLYKYTPAAWQLVPGSYSVGFNNLRTSSSGVFIIDDGGVRRVDSNGVTTVVPAPAGTADAVRARDGSYYVANYSKGLLRVQAGTGTVTESFVANGPASNLAFSVLADARTNIVDIFTGRYGERYDVSGYRAGFYEYNAGQWTNFDATNYPNPTDYPNPISPVRGTRTPDGKLYVGHFNGGLLEWEGPGKFRQFGVGKPSGSPLLGTFGDPTRVDITDLASTADGKVWVVNRHLLPGTSGLFLLDPATTTWQTTPYAFGMEALERIALDDNGYVWVSVSRKPTATGAAIGLYAVDPNAASGNAPRLFSTAAGLPDNQIYELVKDRRGYIWAATIKGVALFNDPSGPFLSAAGFTLPVVRRGEGTGFPALFSEAVRTLAVDGADRKWFGTDNGLWLFSPDADEALLHFTTANSPLPSNRIVDVKVNDKTGEVWVATDAGVVAYRGSATVTEGEPHCTAAFPNPVRPDFQGTVGISGLANNALVKITDVAGHLVYATTATGGAVTWNLTMPDGQRVRSGIYLVLSSDADGKNGCVSKVAVLSK
ncbi:ligand-binding sensor domain-containing protein [Hymenobacter sp. UYAg731]